MIGPATPGAPLWMWEAVPTATFDSTLYQIVLEARSKLNQPRPIAGLAFGGVSFAPLIVA